MLRPREAELLEELGRMRATGSYPFRPTIIAADGPHCEVEGVGAAVMFASCDYLGLSQHPRVKEAAVEAVRKFGANTYGAQVFCGYTSIHRELEAAIARFLGKQDALLFPSGMHANIGVLGTLLGSRDVVIHDRLNHVSLFMGGAVAGATQRSYRHLDMAHLEAILVECASHERRLIATDGAFSADGDLAPLPEICTLAERHGALVLVDEAHSVGVFGPTGAGLAELQGCGGRADLLMGTMSKAFGSVGGFVAGDTNMIDLIRHTAPAYTSSRGSPPAVVAASLAALEVNAEVGDALRAALHRNIDFALEALRAAGLDCLQGRAASVPVRIGDRAKTMAAAGYLLERGLVVSAMVPPTVPPGTSRLRIGITAAHEPGQIARLVESIADAKVQLGF